MRTDFPIRLLLILLLSMTCPARALDRLVFEREASPGDKRAAYAHELMHEVMERTVPKYGPYTITVDTNHMERDRLVRTMAQGGVVNVTSSPADANYLSKLLWVDIPIDMGLQSWRIALVDAEQAARVRSAAEKGELKQLRAGVGSTWVSRTFLHDNGYRYVAGGNYDGLFDMLMAGRFDYFPRGVHEIFPEYDLRRARWPRLAVDESFLIHANMPMLFFISPSEPRLQQRVQAGMEAMLKDGSLERFVLKHYRAALQRAKLCKRLRIELVNTDLPPDFPIRKEAWLDPFAPRLGLCSPS